MEKTLTFTFPESVWNYITQLLGKQPFETVAPVIGDIQRQLNEQKQQTVTTSEPLQGSD